MLRPVDAARLRSLAVTWGCSEADVVRRLLKGACPGIRDDQAL